MKGKQARARQEAEAGFEPANNGFAIRPPATPTSDHVKTCADGVNCLSPRLLPALEKHPELIDLIAAWPTLPEALRAGIRAMIAGAVQKG